MGFGDTLRKGILDATGVSKITAAIPGPAAPAKDQGDFIRPSKTTAGTTSGLDAAMQAHADEKHPVAKRKPAMGADWDQ